MLLGKVLAEAAMRKNKFITWLPAYGAEVRGGTAYCMIIISDKEIGSPYIHKADTLIIMNNLSLEKFKNRIKKNGLMLINASFIKNDLLISPKMLKYSFTDIAKNMGNIKVANMIALGSYLANRKILDTQTVIKAIEEMTPPEKKYLIEINKEALLAGKKLTLSAHEALTGA